MANKSGTVLDRAGLSTSGYITKKGTPVTMGAEIGYIFNRMPPGMDIENQDVADIRAESMKQIVETSGYPGDGWQGGQEEAKPEPMISNGTNEA